MTKSTKYLAIILTILLLAASYFWFGKKSKAPASAENNGEVQTITEEQLGLLRRLRNLHLDASVLQDEKFKVLLSQDELTKTSPSSTTTKPGRINPFLPF